MYIFLNKETVVRLMLQTLEDSDELGGGGGGEGGGVEGEGEGGRG